MLQDYSDWTVIEMKIKYEFFILIIILFFSTALRFINLDKIPAGLYVDEASIGFNAYSILKTGKDEYGKPFPIFFRSFATFQSPLYVYLATIPIYLFGLNMFSVRFISALSGVCLVLITYLFVKKSQIKNNTNLALLSALVLGLSPWAIFQSRVAVESNLALTIFILSLYLFLLSFKKIVYFIPASAILALSSYAYPGERVLSFIFLPLIIFCFKKYFLNNKKFVLAGILIFLLICLPQLLLLTSPGFLRRFDTQGFVQDQVFNKFGGDFREIPVAGKYLYIGRKFIAQYVSSYSPRNLFFNPEDQLFRSMPNMSTFYFWMVIPFTLGIKQLWEKRSSSTFLLIILVIIFGSIPAAITNDPFYTLRMLPMLWGISILISFGIFYLIATLQLKFIQYLVAIFLFTTSCLMFYSSYFIIFKNDRSYAFGYPYYKLAQDSEKTKDKKFILSTEIYDAPYILMAFYKSLNPIKMQQQSSNILIKNYYTDITFNKYRTIDNVNVKPLDWGIDPCIDQIIVRDAGTFSNPQSDYHHMTLIKEYKDLTDRTILWAYQTNPKEECKK